MADERYMSVTMDGGADTGMVFLDTPEGLTQTERYAAYLRLQAEAGELSDEEYLERLDGILKEGDDFGKGDGTYSQDGPGSEDGLTEAQRQTAVQDSTEELDPEPEGDVPEEGAGLLERMDRNGRMAGHGGAREGTGASWAVPHTEAGGGMGGAAIEDDADGMEHDGEDGGLEGTLDEEGMGAPGGPGADGPEDGMQEGGIDALDGGRDGVEPGPEAASSSNAPSADSGAVDVAGPSPTEEGAPYAADAPEDAYTADPGGLQPGEAEAYSMPRAYTGADYVPETGMEPGGTQPEAGTQDGKDAAMQPGTGTHTERMMVGGGVRVHEQAFVKTDFLDDISEATGLYSSVQTAEYVPPKEVSVQVPDQTAQLPPLPDLPERSSGKQFEGPEL